MKFYITDQSGNIVRHGDCPEDAYSLQAGAGETVHRGEPKLKTMPPLFDTSYSGGRRRDYPAIADQLDALWHAMNSGEIPKADAFFNTIQAVKAKYPKV